MKRHPNIIPPQSLFESRNDDYLGAGGFGVVFVGDNAEIVYKYGATSTECEATEIAAYLGVAPKVYECDWIRTHDGNEYQIAMQNLQGFSDLNDWFEKVGRGIFPLQTASTVLLNLIEALHKIHQADLAHGDLKPDNILVHPSGEVKLIDFGLTKKGQQAVGIEIYEMLLRESLFLLNLTLSHSKFLGIDRKKLEQQIAKVASRFLSQNPPPSLWDSEDEDDPLAAWDDDPYEDIEAESCHETAGYFHLLENDTISDSWYADLDAMYAKITQILTKTLQHLLPSKKARKGRGQR